jgi:hypothetical protein
MKCTIWSSSTYFPYFTMRIFEGDEETTPVVTPDAPATEPEAPAA